MLITLSFFFPLVLIAVLLCPLPPTRQECDDLKDLRKSVCGFEMFHFKDRSPVRHKGTLGASS